MKQIDSTESRVLFKNKVREGLSENMADFEIKRDKLFVAGTNQLKSRADYTQKELQRAYAVITELKNKLRLKIKKRFDKKLDEIKNGVNLSKNKIDLATTRDLTRILSLLQSEGKLGLDDLHRTTHVKPKILKNALSFLLKFNFIEQKLEGRVICFKLIIDNKISERRLENE